MPSLLRRPRRRAAGGLLALFAFNLVADVARAALLTWAAPVDGSAATSTNWLPAQVPVAIDQLEFAVSGTYTVTFPSATDTVVRHAYRTGDVTVACTSPHSVKAFFSVSGQDVTTRVTSGTLRAGTITEVIGLGLGNATLRVSGAGTNFLQNTSSIGEPVFLVGGSGTLLVRNGGLVQPSLRINVGRDAGSLGTLSVRGDGVLNSNLRRSSVVADSTASDCHVGLDGGHGIVEVLDGGLLRIGRDVVLAEVAGDSSDVTIGGSGVIDSATIRVKDDLFVSANATSAAGGVANITLDPLGVLVVDDSTVVGDTNGSSALITLHPGSRMITKHLILQQPSGSSIDLESGLLQVKGGTFSTFTNRLVIPGNLDADRPVLELLNGATATFTGTTSNPPLNLGTTASVELHVLGASVLTANGGSTILGEQTDGIGTIEVRDKGSFVSNRSLVLGPAGIGQLKLKTGGLATADGLDLSPTASGLGYVDVRDAGSVLTSTGPLNIGGTTTAAGNGSASVFVFDGGRVNLTAPLNAGTVWPDATLQVVRGDVDATGVLTVRGDLDLTAGDVTGGTIALRGNGRITGEGSVASTILGGTDTTVAIIASGPLTLGRDAPGTGVLLRGQLDVGTAAVTLVDPDTAVVGIVEMSGGDLFLPPGGGVLETDKRVIGEGTIHGGFVPHGYVLATGAGLRFAGTVYGAGQGTNGTVIEFLNGGGFQGSGTIAAKVQGDAGSLILATGPLNLGVPALPNGVVIGGRLETGPYPVTLASQSPVDIDGVLALDRGVVIAAGVQTLDIGAGGRIEGRGTVLPEVVVSGAVAPGASAGKLAVGRLTTTGAYEADLGRHVVGEWDTLSVTTSATLGGTLALHHLPTYSATMGDSFKVLECASRTGTFTVVTLDGAPLAGEFVIAYANNGVWAIAQQTILDVGDGGLDRPQALRLAPIGSPGSRPAVELALPEATRVRVSVFDLQGRVVARAHDGALAAGTHRFDVARDLGGAGIYFVRAVVGERTKEVRTARIVRTR